MARERIIMNNFITSGSVVHLSGNFADCVARSVWRAIAFF
jgi:hypothetical protein